jgi:Kef-type K+ transport system membrane component KefB
MDPLMQFLLIVSIIIVAAKGAGYLSIRLGQPAVLGEILAGLVLGPTLLDILHWPIFSDPHLEETISHLAHLGVLFLMFIVGLEVDLGSMRRSGRSSVFAGILGAVVPLAFGAAAASLFGFEPQQSLFIGLMLAATSVSISAQVLMEMGVLRSRVGTTLLGAVVVDDILVILLLSLFTLMTGDGGGGTSTVILVLARMAVFLGSAIWFGMRIIPSLVSRIERFPISEGVMALVIVSILLYSWASEAFGGIAAIIGAFLAGLFFARTTLKHTIESGVRSLAYAWLVPIFFVSIGLETNARSLGVDQLPFALAIVGVAILSKVVGGGLGSRLGGLTNLEALRLGVGMSARGEVLLIVATLGLDTGIIENDIFASMILVVLATTLLTPLMLRILYPGQKPNRPGITSR